jgi:hypothetical protein
VALRIVWTLVLASCARTEAPPSARVAPVAPPPAVAAAAPGVLPLAPIRGWTWENPLSGDLGATGIWGTARDDVWAVGNAGLIAHWDGHAWTTVPGLRKSNLYAVGGSGRDDVWAVGYVGTALHWDGKTWSDHPIEHGYYPEAIGFGARGPWVATEDGVSLWDGTAWQFVAPTPCRFTVCSGSLTRSAGGAAAIRLPTGLWDGDGIANQLPQGGRAGVRGSQLWLTNGLLSRHLFGAVTRFPAPFYVRAIGGATDDDVWAGGDDGRLARWDGASWQTVASGVRGALVAIWGIARDDVWIGGDRALLHWDGKRLASTMKGTDADLYALWGASSCDVWAAGDSGTLLHRPCGPWTAIATGVTTRLQAIGGSGANDVWIAGDHGVLLHWDGQAIVRVESMTDKTLRGVWAASASDAWAVGETGTIRHWDGKTWEPVASPVSETLSRVTGDGQRIVAGGRSLITWDGTRWQLDAWPCDGEITGIVLDGADTLAACHSAAVHSQRSGTGWNGVIGSQGLASVYLAAAGTATTIAISGWYGTVAQRTNGKWEKLDAPTAWPLEAVWVAPDGATWVAGRYGEILVHR